ncbi:MAG: formylglycine-generating enzyme family protein [Bdellovibrionales bacterium]|nr:formylglycine-generating enzyme family protein [Bdellovibrionales bacterium]
MALTFIWIGALLISFSGNAADELIRIPSGEVKAIWLVPKSKEENNKNKNELPRVKVKAFYLMKYPVTVQQFAQFLKNNGKDWGKASISRLFADASYLEDWKTQKKNLKSPITNISWFAARAYCESHQMRLPTMNEWEYVAAASEKNIDGNGDALFLKRILEWYGEPKKNKLPAVGSIYKNFYGIWDMHGLIWEWVDDFNSTFVTGESREDSSFNKKMFCGAGALSLGDRENYAAYMRFAFRSSLKGTNTVWNLGFRCARSQADE